MALKALLFSTVLAAGVAGMASANGLIVDLDPGNGSAILYVSNNTSQTCTATIYVEWYGRLTSSGIDRWHSAWSSVAFSLPAGEEYQTELFASDATQWRHRVPSTFCQ